MIELHGTATHFPLTSHASSFQSSVCLHVLLKLLSYILQVADPLDYFLRETT